MNLLFRVIHSSCCRSTHHKLALDALRHFQGPQSSNWRNLFLKHYEGYLEGSKVPDDELKDFRNHVLYVRDNYWGGAPREAQRWYDSMVKALERKDWKIAVYDAGILSHYYTDPIHPFHTGQSEEETNIHRAVEWSIAKSYDDIWRILERSNEFPHVELPDHENWLSEMVVEGAELANGFYEDLIEHYNIDHGVKRPREGLDRFSMEILATLIGYATVGFARILERAFQDANVQPPDTNVTLRGVLSTLQIPVFRITRKLADDQERSVVEAMYEELRRTGQVEKTLSEDDRMVRDLHEKEVLQAARRAELRSVRGRPAPIIAKPRSMPEWVQKLDETSVTSEPQTRPLRFYLEITSDVEEAPSIGPKSAKRLARIGVHTVADLLAKRPEEIAARLSVRHVTPQVAEDWQHQATLVCRIPQLRGLDAQLLVACGWRTAESVARTQPDDMLAAVQTFGETPDGQRILRSGKPPDMKKVTNWMKWAQQSRVLRAA